MPNLTPHYISPRYEEKRRYRAGKRLERAAYELLDREHERGNMIDLETALELVRINSPEVKKTLDFSKPKR